MLVSLIKKHVSVPVMSRMPWNRRPHLLPVPHVQSGCSWGSFMSAMYSISFPVTGWMTAFSRRCQDQWLSPRVMAMGAVSLPQKSSWDKLRGESLCERVGTLGGDGRSVLGVTTLGGNGEMEMSCVFLAIGAWESSRFDLMIQQGMGVGRP
jgi:hypothetical protein